jgi:hypothetical protein
MVRLEKKILPFLPNLCLPKLMPADLIAAKEFQASYHQHIVDLLQALRVSALDNWTHEVCMFIKENATKPRMIAFIQTYDVSDFVSTCDTLLYDVSHFPLNNLVKY